MNRERRKMTQKKAAMKPEGTELHPPANDSDSEVRGAVALAKASYAKRS
jgi:hypothetical protein